MASWRFLGSASRSVNRWWKAVGFQSISWLSWILATCILPFCLLALLPVRFDKPTPNRQAEIVQEEHLWSASLGPARLRSHPNLGISRSWSSTTRSHQSAVHAVSPAHWDRWDRLRPAETCVELRLVPRQASGERGHRLQSALAWHLAEGEPTFSAQNDALAPGETRCSQTYGWIWRLLFYSTFILGRSSSRVGA